HEGIARVDDQRYAHRLPRPSSQMRPLSAGRWRQLRALHMAEEHRGSLEYGAVLEVAAQTAAAFLAGPGVTGKLRLATLFERGHDVGLQSGEPLSRLLFLDAHGYSAAGAWPAAG